MRSVDGVSVRKRRGPGGRGCPGVDQGARAMGPATPSEGGQVVSRPRSASLLPCAPCSMRLATATDNLCYRSDDPLRTPAPRTGNTRDAPLGTTSFLRRPVSGVGAPTDSEATLSPRGLVPEPPSTSTLQVSLLFRACAPTTCYVWQGCTAQDQFRHDRAWIPARRASAAVPPGQRDAGLHYPSARHPTVSMLTCHAQLSCASSDS